MLDNFKKNLNLFEAEKELQRWVISVRICHETAIKLLKQRENEKFHNKLRVSRMR